MEHPSRPLSAERHHTKGLNTYAETYDLEIVIQNSLQKMAAFPNGGGGMGEDVVWEPRGRDGFISSHRVLKCGTHSGPFIYGQPPGRDYVSRPVAHCLVRGGRIVEEWLARDEYAVVTCLGLDPPAIATDLARRSPVTGTPISAAPVTGMALAERIADPARIGVSGARPDRHRAEGALSQEYYATVWNRRLFHRARDFVSGRVFCHTTRMKRVQGLQAYEGDIINLLARFPDAQIEILDIAIRENDEIGTRAAVIWMLRGHYTGAPAYGPANGAPVAIPGASHFEIEHGKLAREWRVFDEIAVMAQIIAHANRSEHEGRP